MIDKKPKQFHVHILMAIAFLGYTPNGNKIVVDHIDNNPLNNTLENLKESCKDIDNEIEILRSKCIHTYMFYARGAYTDTYICSICGHEISK